MRQSALWTINVEAWNLFWRLQGRAVRTLDLAGPLVLRETADRDLAAVWDLLERLSICYEIVLPQESRP